MNEAVFLDRDGVINELIFNPKTGEYESPHFVKDFQLLPGVVESLGKLQEAGFLLFLISNQPSYAKGKTTLEELRLIHEKLNSILKKNNILFQEYFYCYHHPNGIVPEYTKKCECRKPGNYFIEKAKKDYGLDCKQSFIVGDCDTDVECGKKSGLTAILVKNKHSAAKQGRIYPDFQCNNLKEAVDLIVNLKYCLKDEGCHEKSKGS